jgi:isochorismate synthase
MKVSVADTIYTLQNKCLNGNIPFVTYCLPKQKDIVTMVQYRSKPIKLESLKQINKKKGFVIAPFKENESFPLYFLEPDFTIHGLKVEENIFEELQSFDISETYQQETKDYYVAEKSEFMEQVNKITGTIREKTVDKVVLSRIQLVNNHHKTEALEIFYALCAKYPRAFKYIFNIPGAGCWLGATPEPLVEISNNQVQTVSLAGTQNLNGITAEKVKWQSKELEEQKFVTDFIENKILKFGITEYEKQGPMNQQAANLVHLKSVFTFNSQCLKGKTGEFIAVLHPTPSVCGLPRRKAYDYINKLERHNREYYTGFLGPVNIDDSTHVFVNLRCMKMLPDQFALFVGAGITLGSDPESEWEETNQKMMTMLNVINSLNSK